MLFSFNNDDPSRDVEDALGQLTSMTLGDQDRAGAFIQHNAVQDWLLSPHFGALLVHGNGRRHDPISPTSVGCALLIYIFSEKLHFPTLYWFCGLHINGPNGSPLGMVQSLICQLLCLSCCNCRFDDQKDLDTQNLNKLLKLLKKLLRRSSGVPPAVCIIDGISYYESRHQTGDTRKIIRKLAKLAKADPPVLMLLITSPTRTSYIYREPNKAEHVAITEVPAHFSGAKQGLNHREVVSTTEQIARKLSESFSANGISI